MELAEIFRRARVGKVLTSRLVIENCVDIKESGEGRVGTVKTVIEGLAERWRTARPSVSGRSGHACDLRGSHVRRRAIACTLLHEYVMDAKSDGAKVSTSSSTRHEELAHNIAAVRPAGWRWCPTPPKFLRG